MNEKRIQEVIEIERRAQEILLAATRGAEHLPIQATIEAQTLLDQARATAREDARKILEQSKADDEVAALMSKAQERLRETEQLATKNLERAVAYVMARVLGTE